MKNLIFIAVLMFTNFAIASVAGFEFDIGNPLTKAFGATSNETLWIAGNVFVSDKFSVGAEFFDLKNGGDGYTLSGSKPKTREHSVHIQQYGLRVAAYLSGVATNSWYGALSSGLSRRVILSAIDQSELQHSGYGTLDVGYQFFVLQNVSIKTGLVWAMDDFSRMTYFSDGSYDESIRSSDQNGGGLRLALSAQF